MGKDKEHLALGQEGEEAAVRYLQGLGWHIRHRNWRPRGPYAGLELDIVAKNKDGLIFVEVKTRSGRGVDGEADGIPAHAAFNRQKMARLERAVGRYLTEQELWNLPCRFDLVCVLCMPDGEKRLEHYKDVIEFGHVVDSGNASWQPW